MCSPAIRLPIATPRRKLVLILFSFSSFLALLVFSTFYYDIRVRLPVVRMPTGLYSKKPELELVGGPLTTPPPTYDKIYAEERALPQHNLSLPFPEGGQGRYIRFTNQIRALGWNNVLNEILLCNHLAWRAKRAYVFEDYWWKPEYYPWRITTAWPVPRTPLSALIAGPTAGGSWEEGDDAPRSVSVEWFYKSCPREDIEVINTDIAKEPIRNMDGKYVLEHWLRLINESPKRCIEIVGEPSPKDNYPQTFDLWVISTPKILTLWPEFRESPVSRLLKTSPLVKSAVARNEHLLFPLTSKTAALPNPYDGLMAIHLRRGDYLGACQGLADWSSTFYQWNLLPELPDVFTPPPGGDWGKNTPENEAIYFERCYPSEDQLIAKIQRSKYDWETEGDGRVSRPKLRSLYIMTNADPEWVRGFKSRLHGEGWETIISSADLTLDDEQISVGMAVDMDIGRQAGVFIGNGWSSMTSNVVYRRVIDGHKPLSTRHW